MKARTDIRKPPILLFPNDDHLTLRDLLEGTMVFGSVGAGKTSPNNNQSTATPAPTPGPARRIRKQ